MHRVLYLFKNNSNQAPGSTWRERERERERAIRFVGISKSCISNLKPVIGLASPVTFKGLAPPQSIVKRSIHDLNKIQMKGQRCVLAGYH